MSPKAKRLCSKCQKRPAAEHQYLCRECARKSFSDYYQAHREEVNAKARERYAKLSPEEKRWRAIRAAARRQERMTDPVYRERQKKYSQHYYQTHKEECDARTRAWRDANRDCVNYIARKWHANHPEYMREYNKNRKKRAKNSQNQVPALQTADASVEEVSAC